jgi:hypothetical protein
MIRTLEVVGSGDYMPKLDLMSDKLKPTAGRAEQTATVDVTYDLGGLA